MNEEEFYYKRLLTNNDYKVFIEDHPSIRRANINETGFNTENILKTLKEEYVEIYNSIESEDYFISDTESFFYLYEIKDEDKIIGFATFTIYDKKSIIMNQIYVLPEYRGQKHFVKTYNFISNLFKEANIFIRNPNRSIINNITHLNNGIIINNRFLISNIIFVFDQAPFNDTLNYSNKTFYDKNKSLYYTESNLYDLELDAVIKISSNNKIYTGKEDLLKVERSSISLVRYEDEKLYNILDKRRNDSWIIKGNYFKKVSKILKKNKLL